MTGPAEIGVLCLDTSFTKIPGHIRNPVTCRFPLRYKVVRGATPRRVVGEAGAALLPPFLVAAQELEAEGVAAITGACGYLVLFQRELAAAVNVPVYASSLIQLPMVHRMLRPGQLVGLLAADADALTPRHLAAVGAESVPVCVAGMSGQPEFREVMMTGQRDELDAARLEGEAVSVAGRLAAEHPDLGALIIECTDLVPFAAAIQQRIGVPVFDIITLTEMIHLGLTRRPYNG